VAVACSEVAYQQVLSGAHHKDGRSTEVQLWESGSCLQGLGRRVMPCPRQSGHVTRAAQHLDDYIERIIGARLQQPDAIEVFTTPADPDLDTTALHTEAAAIAAPHRPVRCVR
jgi:hypothetical protein